MRFRATARLKSRNNNTTMNAIEKTGNYENQINNGPNFQKITLGPIFEMNDFFEILIYLTYVLGHDGKITLKDTTSNGLPF